VPDHRPVVTFKVHFNVLAQTSALRHWNQIYSTELEMQPQFEGFQDRLGTFELWRGRKSRNSDHGHNYVGTFKVSPLREAILPITSQFSWRKKKGIFETLIPLCLVAFFPCFSFFSFLSSIMLIKRWMLSHSWIFRWTYIRARAHFISPDFLIIISRAISSSSQGHISIYRWPHPDNLPCKTRSGRDMADGLYGDYPLQDSVQFLLRLYVIKG